MSNKTRIERIMSKLEKLKQKDAKMEVFGAGDNPWYNIIGHHYEMRPTLMEAQVTAIEKIIAVSLPEEYRDFLLQFGDGGAGPAWGMLELSNTFGGEDFLKEYPEFCSMEFSYYNSYADGILAAIENDLQLRGPFDEHFGGYIKLAHYGHDMWAILIVSGEQRGKMWLLDEEKSITPFYQKIEGRTPGVSFLDWFENWLDQNLEPGSIPVQF